MIYFQLNTIYLSLFIIVTEIVDYQRLTKNITKKIIYLPLTHIRISTQATVILLAKTITPRFATTT
mgnify:CR=1 FL=1